MFEGGACAINQELGTLVRNIEEKNSDQEALNVFDDYILRHK